MDDRLEKILDLTIEFDAVTKDEATRELAKLLAHQMQTRMTSAAFVYLITGEKQYAETAFDVLVTRCPGESLGMVYMEWCSHAADSCWNVRP